MSEFKALMSVRFNSDLTEFQNEWDYAMANQPGPPDDDITSMLGMGQIKHDQVTKTDLDRYRRAVEAPMGLGCRRDRKTETMDDSLVRLVTFWSRFVFGLRP